MRPSASYSVIWRNVSGSSSAARFATFQSTTAAPRHPADQRARDLLERAFEVDPLDGRQAARVVVPVA